MFSINPMENFNAIQLILLGFKNLGEYLSLQEYCIRSSFTFLQRLPCS